MTKHKKNKPKQRAKKTSITPASTKRSSYSPASFGRRVGALIYDLLLNIGIWLTTTLLFVSTYGLFNDGQGPAGSVFLQYTLFPLLVFTSFIFYGWFWTHGGKTLGMQAWHIRAVTAEGEKMSWLSSFKRAVFSGPLVGLGCIGLLWVYINKDKHALHDLLSNTYVVHIPKEDPAPKKA